jgi:hypothetical protein
MFIGVAVAAFFFAIAAAVRLLIAVSPSHIFLPALVPIVSALSSIRHRACSDRLANLVPIAYSRSADTLDKVGFCQAHRGSIGGSREFQLPIAKGGR